MVGVLSRASCVRWLEVLVGGSVAVSGWALLNPFSGNQFSLGGSYNMLCRMPFDGPCQDIGH